MLDRVQDGTQGLLSSKMIMRKLCNTVQAVIFIGLFVSGAMLALGLGSSHPEWGRPGVLLGWVFGTLSVSVYIIALPLAIYRNAARQFWRGWSPLNFGLTLSAATLMFTRIEQPIVLAWLSLLGVAIAAALHRWHGVASRYVMILVNMMLFAPTLPFFERYWEVLIFPLATAFVIVPTVCAANVGPLISSPESPAAAPPAPSDPPR